MTKSQKTVHIELKEFDMSRISDNKIILMIGKRNTGKTKLALDFLFHHQDIPFATCISPTDELTGDYRRHIPSRFIFDDYTPELLASFLTRQRRMKSRKQQALNGTGDPRYRDVDPRGILIMDDLLATVDQWKNDKSLIWLFTNGRHADCTLVLTLQYQTGIGPLMRTNLDFVFLCKETKRTEKEKLWKYYAGMFPTYAMFEQVFTKCTVNYGCMVIDNTTQSDKIDEQVYWYKARLHGDFRVCYDEFWENNEDYIKKDDLCEPVGTKQSSQSYQGNSKNVIYDVSIVPGSGA